MVETQNRVILTGNFIAGDEFRLCITEAAISA